MSRIYAPHDASYQTPRYATEPQIARIENTLTTNSLHAEPFDRLWKLLEAHRINERTPGDGTPMARSKASQIIDWLTAQGYRPHYGDREQQAPREPLPDIPAGHYATPSRTGNNDLDFWRIDRPEEGRWAGWTFVKRMIGGHPEIRVRGQEARQALAAIKEAGIETSRDRYAEEIGRCWRCNIELTDDLSRLLHIGPDCCPTEYGMSQAQRAKALGLAVPAAS